MSVEENYLETILKKYFQKNISLIIDGEELKSGLFMLYALTIYSNNYYIEFHVKRDKKTDIIKIPYPFKAEEYEKDGLLYLDYRISTLCKNNSRLINKIETATRNISSVNDNKFYNKILEIQFT